MEEKLKNAIENYQCPGCVNGGDIRCYSDHTIGAGCGNHYSGTSISGIGKILLGMPKGFNRIGDVNLIPRIFNDYNGNRYDMYNIPVWKYLDEHGNTIVRGIMPRINEPFIDILLGNWIDQVNCLEITNEMLENMD